MKQADYRHVNRQAHVVIMRYVFDELFEGDGVAKWEDFIKNVLSGVPENMRDDVVFAYDVPETDAHMRVSNYFIMNRKVDVNTSEEFRKAGHYHRWSHKPLLVRANEKRYRSRVKELVNGQHDVAVVMCIRDDSLSRKEQLKLGFKVEKLSLNWFKDNKVELLINDSEEHSESCGCRRCVSIKLVAATNLLPITTAKTNEIFYLLRSYIGK